MKKIAWIIFTVMLISVTVLVSQDIRARTLSGETVILKKNGTWILLNRSAPPEDTALTFDGRVIVLRRNGTWQKTDLNRSTATIPAPSFPQSSVTKLSAETGTRTKSEGSNSKKSDNFIGRQVPSFTYRNLDGSEVDINRLKGKVVLINFWAAWCAPCLKEIPLLETEVWQRFKTKNFAMIALTTDHTENDLKNFIRQYGFTFPMGFDREQTISRLFNVTSIPRNYVVGKDGTILYQSAGFGEEQFKSMVDKISQAILQ